MPADERGPSPERKAADTARRLEARGWHTVVELHDEDGASSYLQVHTYGELHPRPRRDVRRADGTAGFINVVGNITPEEVGRIGRTFNIEALERFDEGDDDG